MEKRRLISLRSVLLQYLVRTALACLLVAVGWLLALMLWIQNGELGCSCPRIRPRRPARRPHRTFCQA